MNPAMKFHASPWSPPGWMKTNGSQTGGGELKSDDRTLRSHAGYLVKFLQAYAEQGIFINRLCPQNEPLVAGSYPGCKIPAPLYSKAVREWIIPAVKNAGLKTEIWAGTFNYWNPETHEHFESVLNDTELAHAIGGISFQYSHLPWVHQYHAKYPEVPIQFSESQCFGGNNTETEALRDFQDFASYTRAGSRLFTFWNIVLPEPRKSSWGWRQNSLVVIDKDKQTIMYEPDFALAQLLGRHIITGTRYLPSTIVKGDTLLGALHYPPTEGIGFMKSELENGEQVVAFAKPDGTIVLFVMNQGPSVMTEIRFGGKHVCVMLPEKRLSAIILK
jgi:glucosylceramidase